MSVDVIFFRPACVGDLKKDKNLSFVKRGKNKFSSIKYKNSELGIYGTDDNDLFSLARYIGSDFSDLVEYLWKTYKTMCFDDCNNDDQTYYHIMTGMLEERGITEDDAIAFAEHFCAEAMTSYFEDPELNKIIKKTQEEYDKVMLALGEYFEDRKKEPQVQEISIRTVDDEDLPF